MVLQFQTRHVTQKNMLENVEIKSEFEKFETAGNRLQCHQIVAPLCGQFLIYYCVFFPVNCNKKRMELNNLQQY
jgi:hypothetical protein